MIYIENQIICIFAIICKHRNTCTHNPREPVAAMMEEFWIRVNTRKYLNEETPRCFEDNNEKFISFKGAENSD